jgi:hypothetical protein
MGDGRGEILIKNEVEKGYMTKKLLDNKKKPYKPCTKLNIF